MHSEIMFGNNNIAQHDWNCCCLYGDLIAKVLGVINMSKTLYFFAIGGIYSQ